MRSVVGRPLPPDKQDFIDTWRIDQALAATTAVCGSPVATRGEKMEQLKSVYQALRDHLLWLFHNKCAYCEVDYRSAPVQVEHFRPKRKVTGASDHPGYYWVMFDAENLLPSCARCNNKKRNAFPVQGTRAMDPTDDLNKELPALLDPSRDTDNEIAKHVTVITDESDPNLFGALKCLDNSPRAQYSIKVYGLNDGPKIQARQMEMKTFLREYKDAYADKARRDELLSSLREGRRQYSFACAAMLLAWLQQIEQEVKTTLGDQPNGKP